MLDFFATSSGGISTGFADKNKIVTRLTIGIDILNSIESGATIYSHTLQKSYFMILCYIVITFIQFNFIKSIEIKASPSGSPIKAGIKAGCSPFSTFASLVGDMDNF